jgi:preprotein translocase subunit SecA
VYFVQSFIWIAAYRDKKVVGVFVRFSYAATGMTGTGKQRRKFQDIYNLEVIVLPTQKPMARKDLTDFVYQTELSK